METLLSRLATILALRPAPGLWRNRTFLGLLIGGTAAAIAVGALFPSATPLERITILLSVTFWQPTIEELLFRGVIQGELLRQAWGRSQILNVSAANGVTSLAFAGLHLVHHTGLWAAGVLVPSLAFGFVRERTNSTIPPLILHIAFNAAYFGASLMQS